ncbi:hypothetical protein BDV93DRAFT_510874 [Ceratobasidium sp. AG-I]|nr:hypothetical protein BDV93DRAFT_510874 [Ceratobasidium sp. AG-I]
MASRVLAGRRRRKGGGKGGEAGGVAVVSRRSKRWCVVLTVRACVCPAQRTESVSLALDAEVVTGVCQTSWRARRVSWWWLREDRSVSVTTKKTDLLFGTWLCHAHEPTGRVTPADTQVECRAIRTNRNNSQTRVQVYLRLRVVAVRAECSQAPGPVRPHAQVQMYLCLCMWSDWAECFWLVQAPYRDPSTNVLGSLYAARTSHGRQAGQNPRNLGSRLTEHPFDEGPAQHLPPPNTRPPASIPPRRPHALDHLQRLLTDPACQPYDTHATWGNSAPATPIAPPPPLPSPPPPPCQHPVCHGWPTYTHRAEDLARVANPGKPPLPPSTHRSPRARARPRRIPPPLPCRCRPTDALLPSAFTRHRRLLQAASRALGSTRQPHEFRLTHTRRRRRPRPTLEPGFLWQTKGTKGFPEESLAAARAATAQARVEQGKVRQHRKAKLASRIRRCPLLSGANERFKAPKFDSYYVKGAMSDDNTVYTIKDGVHVEEKYYKSSTPEYFSDEIVALREALDAITNPDPPKGVFVRRRGPKKLGAHPKTRAIEMGV